MSYRIPEEGNEDSYALALLSNILSVGESSRVYQRLVYKDKIASSINITTGASQSTVLGLDLTRFSKTSAGAVNTPVNLSMKGIYIFNDFPNFTIV